MKATSYKILNLVSKFEIYLVTTSESKEELKLTPKSKSGQRLNLTYLFVRKWDQKKIRITTLNAVKRTGI